MLDDNTRKVIGELLREEKNTNSDMLFDLMLYGHLTDENGKQLTGITGKSVKYEATEPTKKSVEIDLTEPNAVITETTTNLKTNTSKTKLIKGCPRMKCVHNTRGHCTSNVVLKYGHQCNLENNYPYYEEADK